MPPVQPLLVTAFGPFGGRKVNASSLALAQLRQADRSLRTRTLPVDLVEAPRRLHDAVRRISPRAVLLLGESGKATTLRLETLAWNELDFLIPDLAGRQPRSQPIDPVAPPRLRTAVPAGRLRQALARAGHPAELSKDPGRYLCNRIYYAALQRSGVPALFVHLPLENRLSPDRAADALRVIINLL